MKTAKVGRGRALLRYFRDPSASMLGKLFVLGAVVYVIMPVDLIPDVPIIGWLDDLGVMTLAVGWMWKVVGRYRDPESTLHAAPARAACAR
ncbi:MAG: DUF1232 domain-containing protein [Labilithrix sp.]|nr:DUF1232 domain-containing protein [Labilithrix sp.]